MVKREENDTNGLKLKNKTNLLCVRACTQELFYVLSVNYNTFVDEF